MKNATSFGKQASTYAKGRPGYPDDLYAWIAENSPKRDLVWDVGTGSGQAARGLTAHFDHVHATDLSTEQIEASMPHPQIFYRATPAHLSGLDENAASAVTVATAVHWFADSNFWNEVRRVGTNHAIFCAWTYKLPRSSRQVQTEFLAPLYEMIDPYWAEGNRICMAGYSAENLNCPLQILQAPVFEDERVWKAQQLVDFVNSWSAHFRAREDGLKSVLDDLSNAFLKLHGEKDISLSMPLSVLAARVS